MIKFATRQHLFQHLFMSTSPFRGCGQDYADAPHPLALLRACRAWPKHRRRRRASKERDELASSHRFATYSMTSSVRASSMGALRGQARGSQRGSEATLRRTLTEVFCDVLHSVRIVSPFANTDIYLLLSYFESRSLLIRFLHTSATNP
jgi:hypothetical protein